MKTRINLPLLALVSGSLLAFGTPAALAANSTIKIKEKVTVSFDLLPPLDAPSDAEGSAEIKVEAKNDQVKGKLKLSVTGLADGVYSVDATLEDDSTIHIADLSVGANAEDPADDGKVSIKLPETLDARTIASLTISDAIDTVVLEADADAETTFLRYFANVSVTGPETEAGEKNSKVKGHALAHTKLKGDKVTERFFLFNASGAPESATLNINVNGNLVGTVESTDKGKVKFSELPEDIDFTELDVITITDADGMLIMQAEF